MLIKNKTPSITKHIQQYYHGKGGKKQSFGHTRIPFNIHKTSGQIRFLPFLLGQKQTMY